jgi:hypothetical protein
MKKKLREKIVSRNACRLTRQLGGKWGLALFTQHITVIWLYDSADPLQGCCSTANALLKTEEHWMKALAYINQSGYRTNVWRP